MSKSFFSQYYHNSQSNGSHNDSFKVERGVKQDWNLAPYVFLVVGEALTQPITKAIVEHILWEINFHGGNK